MLTKLLGFIAIVMLTLALFVGGAQPEAVGLFEPPLDKVVHFFYYAIVAVCFGRLIGLNVLLTFGIALSIGLADEIHQIYLPGRSADVDDLIADALGISLGCVFDYIKS